MLSSRLRLAALLAVLPALAGCGSVVSAQETTGNQLTVYSSLPLQGPSAPIARQIEGGEKLALSQAGGHAGPFKVSYVSLGDVNPVNGQPSPGESSAAAAQAAKDTSTIAFLGDYGSEATAISLPITNEAGILQVSPFSPYVGLTSSEYAGQDEPQRFYLSGKRNFTRLAPGDQAQAEAQARLMRSLGLSSVYVLDDQGPFESPLANLVAKDAAKEGVKVVGHDSVGLAAEANYAGELEKILASHAQGVFLAAGAGPGAVNLWQRLHAASPRLVLLGSNSLANDSFTAELGAAGAVTYLTTPLLGESLYPPSARRVLTEYTRTFHSEAGPWVLYGYEAMDGVLDAIRRAGPLGNNRPDVIRSYFATRDRDSVIGRYSVMPNGETTLSTYGVDVVKAGRPVFSRAIDTGSPAGPAG
ncbi:MAG: branched-chain amino acid transport system substrate-binding protein [Solirubrobacteraceae bacterium]|nr:transporter substrate-binding protein [Solirubrobacterales bacterium]MEA2214512.1 branched-chain amino acid transport system substrate-binding protein [Solirubrobacteraceae bacterium]